MLVGTARDGVVRVARVVPVTKRETERPAVAGWWERVSSRPSWKKVTG